MRTALLQLNSGDDPAANLPITCDMLDEAVDIGAQFVLTPEVTNCVSSSRAHQCEVLQRQDDDQTLAALRAKAQAHGIWLLIGSLALKTDDADGRFANRSFLITPEGGIAAWYDKIHMFDVTVSETEAYHESKGYRPGKRAVLANMPFGGLGMTICYDVRFPHLYRHLSQLGAQVITAPSAFSRTTGAAHWETLLCARAIETGAYVLAPAQTGRHPSGQNAMRETWGHSLIVDPWGRVLADAGDDPGIIAVDLEPASVANARKSIPAMVHETDFDGP